MHKAVTARQVQVVIPVRTMEAPQAEQATMAKNQPRNIERQLLPENSTSFSPLSFHEEERRK